MSRWTSSDPYVVLGLSHGASMQDIKGAYRQLAKQLHPDGNLAQADHRAGPAFEAVTAAYDQLCRSHGKPRNANGPLTFAANATAEAPSAELRPLGSGVEAQVLVTARLRSYYRQFPLVVAAAHDLRQGSILALKPAIVELFRHSTFTDDEEGVRALIDNTTASMAADLAMFGAIRRGEMGPDALALLAEAIICEAAVQQHEGEMILDGQFFSPVVQSRLALLVRRAEIVIRQLLQHDCMESEGAPPPAGPKTKATPTSSGFAVLD